MSDIIFKKQWFINTSNELITNFYDLDEKCVLGKGTFGQVFTGKNKKTGLTRAIKKIQKKQILDPKRFQTEVEIMKELDHPNIIKLFETFEDPQTIFLVMEVCEGGELFDKISDVGYFNEKDSQQMFRQISLAVNHCHKKGISHRDLKPENFLLLKDDNKLIIKMIDFGLSKMFDPNQESQISMTTKAGTPYYISPEVLKGNYNQQCDIWSMGVILYILLSGVPPFYGDTDPEILDMIRIGEFNFEPSEFDSVSQDAKDLINLMIAPKEQRITSQDVVNHPWVRTGQDKNNLMQFQLIKIYNDQPTYKKFVLLLIASQLSELEIQELGSIYRNVDKNQDGKLTLSEIMQGLKDLNVEQAKNVSSILMSLDTDQSGFIDYTEFIAASISRDIYLQENRLKEAFYLLDANRNDQITCDDIFLQTKRQSVLQQKQIINSFLESFPQGQVSFKMFADFMKK